VAAGSSRRQRAAGNESDHTGVDRELGGGAQRPNELPGDSVERRSDRSGALTPPRRFPKGTAAAGERKIVVKRWLLSVRWAGAARSYEARRAKNPSRGAKGETPGRTECHARTECARVGEHAGKFLSSHLFSLDLALSCSGLTLILSVGLHFGPARVPVSW
jgi:hypothetical protein